MWIMYMSIRSSTAMCSGCRIGLTPHSTVM
jgi:hypothetical protein